METSSLQTRPVLHSAGPIFPSTSTAELESFLPVNSEEISDHMINTGIPKSSASTEEPNYSEPSEVGFLLGTVVGSVLIKVLLLRGCSVATILCMIL